MPKPPFGFDEPRDSLGFLLWQTTITWQRQIKKLLENYQITHPQFVIMATLMWFETQEKTATQIELATLTKLDKMTVSNTLKALVQQALVKRYENENDTRAKTVILTSKGATLVKKLIPLVEQADSEFFKSLKQDEQRSLLQCLRQLV